MIREIEIALTDVVRYPMPTVALLNGHTFAGGLMLSMAHDYRLAPSGKGFLCLNELIFGAPLTPAMSALFRHKLPSLTYRTLVLEAHRFTGQQAIAAGLADELAEGVDGLVKFVEKKELTAKPKSGVYGVLKAEMHKDLIEFLKSPGKEMEEQRFEAGRAADDERKEFGKVWYEQWLKDNKEKAKL